jgi:hypothetical protein
MPAVKFFVRLDLGQICLFLNGHYDSINIDFSAIFITQKKRPEPSWGRYQALSNCP